MCQKSSYNTFSMYIIFHVKTTWNLVYEYLKTKIFSGDTNILPQMHWTSNIFGPSATTIGSFWVLLNYLISNGLIERPSSMLDEIESKTMHKDQEGDWYGKKK